VCGIAGFAPIDPRHKAAPHARRTLRAMRGTLHHRGPDQAGEALVGGVGLATARLSILDVAGSDQPIARGSGRTTVVFNGEIYNFAELREELRARGRRLTTRGDTEVIPLLYEEFGIRGCLERLRGMFAFALYDKAQRRLLLARDRLGIKPLLAGEFGGQLLFASELKACLAHPAFVRQLDPDALAAYLLLEYVPAPATIYRGLRKVPPAHYLELRDGAVTLERYWHPLDAGPATGSEPWLEKLDDLLDRAVTEELVADVPVGTLLSGGIDSSTVSWFAARQDPSLRSFSIGFDEPSFDESAHARLAAECLRTDHHARAISSSQIGHLLERTMGFLDEPLADSSLLPTYALSRLVREAGVKVVLSGDGGDELLAGYPTYLAQQVVEGMPALPGRALELARATVRRLPTRYDNVSRDYQLKRFLDGLGYPLPRRAGVWLGAFLPHEIGPVLGGAPVDQAQLFRGLDGHAAAAAGRDSLTAAQYVDLRTYLVDDILTKVDRASMACSLEVRVPLLDHRLVELALAMPASLRRRGPLGKLILKRLMAGRLPSPIVWRAKKGFGAPVAHWLRGDGRAELMDTLAGGAAGRTGLLDQAEVDRLISEHLQGRADHRRRLWTLLVFVRWLEGPFGPDSC